MSRDSSPPYCRFRSNEMRLWLSVIAYNLGDVWRRLVLPKKIGSWSLTSLHQRLVKMGGRLVGRQVYIPTAARSRKRKYWSNPRRCVALPDTPALTGGWVFTAPRRQAPQ